MVDTIDDLPAIAGGTPVFPDGPPDWPGHIPAVAQSVQRALLDGSWGKYAGPNCERLIERLRDRFEVQHVLLCGSGTIATEIALRGLNLNGSKQGQPIEVALAGYDFSGNFRAVEAIGARPALMEINRDDWCIDPQHLPAGFSDSTRAIIVSHLHGGFADVEQIRRFADERSIAVVEDACQNPGATIAGRPLGKHSDVLTLSFGGSKLLSAGRGGAVLTNNDRTFQRAQNFTCQGNDAFPLSELQAAALLPQLESLDEQNHQRCENVRSIAADLADFWRIDIEAQLAAGFRPAFFKLPWLLDPSLACSREQLVAALQAEGIAVDAGFRGFANRSERRCRKAGTLENCQRAADRTIVFHHPILLKSADQIKRLSAAITRVHRHLNHTAT